ncbi:MAG: hypothetical protein R3293_11690 [Candidatus Promineifilaceae bacterium]|nr:hypothetical protein [Candidatus Promineifilaceae bacterium]
MFSNLTLFLAGAGFGLGIALAGGLVEYWLSLRPGVERSFSQPGCLLFVTGGLALAGFIAIIASFVVDGGIGKALIVGAGVLSGFYTGFIISFSLWLFWGQK